MPAKKRKAPPPTTRTWDEECRAAIASGDAEAIGAIQFKLGELTGAARASVLDLKVPQAVEEWVTLVWSSEEHDQDFDYSTNASATVVYGLARRVGGGAWRRASRAVQATFAVGSAGLEFHINFSCENVAGELTVTVESDLLSYNLSDGAQTFLDVSDETIEAKLRGMGLLGDYFSVQPTDMYATECEEASTDAERRRWLYGMVIDAAIKLVEGEHGRESTLGVELGLGAEYIYGLLRLSL